MILFLTLFVLLVVGIVLIESRPYIETTFEKLPDSYTAIILGASVKADGTPSLVLKDRIDTTIGLYKEGKVTTILVTGDNGTLAYNEVNPVREYLLAHGVPTEDIFLDHAGFDTYSSMYRAKEIFKVYSVIIVTQSFHLPRAVFIARRLGMDAHGMSADKREYLLKNSIREVFADVKAVFEVMYHVKPKYLGEQIPITGDSSPSI